MKYFDEFVSNTYAGSGNQLYFGTNGEIRTGRIFYKISVGGRYRYSILFSNIIDSTFEDGSVSHANLICDSWHIYRMKIGRSKDICAEVSGLQEVYFNGNNEKEVMPREFFSSDCVEMEFSKGDYLCMEITYSGDMIPYHKETLLPTFVYENGEWVSSRQVPFASMIGCDRKVKARIAYLGDSITQGIGTPNNSYKHWNALLSEKLGEEYAFWNLGLGYGRASDAASDGAWLYKAKQNDLVFVCFGVNDILWDATEEEIKQALDSIVSILNSSGIKIVLQTIPPFNYTGDNINKWNNLNLYIKNVLSDKVYMVFDIASLLGQDEVNSHLARYGGHPDEKGNRIWAQELYSELNAKKLLYKYEVV